MASIRDVALRAGVGIGTVSRALNGTGYISEETKKRIMDAVEELGYQPNELAQNLYRNRSGIVGILVPNLDHPFFSSLVKAIQNDLYLKGYRCIVGDETEGQNRLGEFVELLQRNAIDGLISCVDPNSRIDTRMIQKPVVVLDRNWGDTFINIHSDHKSGGAMAAKLLIDAGVKKVLVFRPEVSGRFTYMERYHSFEQTCMKNAVTISYVNLKQNKLGYEYDYTAVWNHRELLREVDGIFAADTNAAACIRLAWELGIRVPQDLKIVGYDGSAFTKYLTPRLTTISQDVPKLARAVSDSMMGLIQGKKNIKKEQIIDVFVMKGESV